MWSLARSTQRGVGGIFRARGRQRKGASRPGPARPHIGYGERMKRLALALVLMFATACSDVTGPDAKLAGSWIGTTQGQTLSMTLVENNGVVSGSGTLSFSTGPIA